MSRLELLEITYLDYLFKRRLNEDKYHRFLECNLPILSKEVSISKRNRMWFIHDGSPAHFSYLALEYLNKSLYNRWSWRTESWPARLMLANSILK